MGREADGDNAAPAMLDRRVGDVGRGPWHVGKLRYGLVWCELCGIEWDWAGFEGST